MREKRRLWLKILSWSNKIRFSLVDVWFSVRVNVSVISRISIRVDQIRFDELVLTWIHVEFGRRRTHLIDIFEYHFWLVLFTAAIFFWLTWALVEDSSLIHDLCIKKWNKLGGGVRKSIKVKEGERGGFFGRRI